MMTREPKLVEIYQSQNLETLLSKERLESYKSVDEHFENLRFVARITPKLATLEIALRNLLDDRLSKTDSEWIKNSQESWM